MANTQTDVGRRAPRFDETLDERLRYENAAQWVGPDRLHLAFHFRLLHSSWGARSFARAIDAWVDVIADVLARDGSSRREAKRRAQSIVAAMEGALIVARVRRSARPILDVARLV